MAITNSGTQNLINTKQLPTNYIRPIIPIFADQEYESVNLVISIAKSTVDNVTNSVTMDNIITDITVQVDVKIANDYDTTKDIELYSNLNELTISSRDSNGDSDWLNTAVEQYLCSVTVFIKVA